MNFFGKLNAIAQNALGGRLGKVDRLDEWSPDSPPEKTDFEALWKEATAPFQPVLDQRVRLRVGEQNVADRIACRQPPVTSEIDGLDAAAKAALAVEALKRYVFLDYCVYLTFNPGTAAINPVERFGISR